MTLDKEGLSASNFNMAMLTVYTAERLNRTFISRCECKRVGGGRGENT